MLRFFRINDPYRLVFVFLIFIGIRVGQSFFIEGNFFLELKWLLLGEWLGKGFAMYRESYDYTGPLAAFVYKYVDIIFGRSAFVHHVLSSIVVIVQAGIFNGILLKNKAYDENGYLPAFLYVILLASVPDFMSLSPQLLSMTFILLALSNVLRRIDNQVTDELFLNSGLFVGVATMIYLPAFVFLFVFLLSLIVFSSAILRRLLLYLFGFFLIGSLCAVYFYWRGDLTYFVNYFLVQGLVMPVDALISIQGILWISAVLLLVLGLAIFRTVSKARLTNFQQRVQQVIWFMFLGGVACLFLTKERTPAELIFFLPLVTYFLTHYFILLRNRLFRFLMPGTIIFGLLAFSVYSYQNLTQQLRVQPVPSRVENVLVLGQGLGYYVDKEAGSPCFNERICQEAFKGLEFYETSSHISRWINKTDAGLIVDRMGIAPDIFARFPLVQEKYKAEGPSTYRRASN